MHAFRKLSRNKLPEYDCHYKLRNQYLKGLSDKEEDICISFAWDWVWRGDTSHSINKELDFLLQVLKDNRRERLGPPAPIGLSLLRMANSLCSAPTEMKCDFLTPADLAVGIAPALTSLVDSQDKIFQNGNAEALENHRLTVIKDKDDTEGVSFCNECSTELINYFWRSKGSQSDLLEQKVDSRDLCNSCFKSRDRHLATEYELRHAYSDVRQLNKMVKDIKNLAGWMF